MTDMNFIEQELESLKAKGRYRFLRTVSGAGPLILMNGRRLINFSSNNYLGLAGHPRVKWAALWAAWRFGTGSGASRLVSGGTAMHEALEEAIARFKGTEKALIYPTGYMANLGAISSLIGREDLIVLDRLNHASLVDGAVLSRAKIWVYPHRDVNRLEEILRRAKEKSFRMVWVVTESLFSMDGDIAPLPDILKVCELEGAHLMIDEAHATGVLGERGRGALEHFGIRPERVDIIMGTMSKALGSLGGFIAGRASLIDYLVNKSKSFIYTTALPSAVCASALKALEILESGNDRVIRLKKNVRYFLDGLRERGFALPEYPTPIVPVLVGEDGCVLRAAQSLADHGVFAPGIRPPTVPEGEGRIRFSLMATHRKEHLDRALEALEEIKRQIPSTK